MKTVCKDHSVIFNVADSYYVTWGRRSYTCNYQQYFINDKLEARDGEADKINPETDCGSDHELLTSNIRINLKKSTKIILVPKYNLNMLSD